MILGISTILIAMAISAVSAYYSVLGLTAIFAAATIPVIVMGLTLEAGKIMVAVWLHQNWQRAGVQYKLYLVPALIFLMLLTSIGVFGFLSKAHLDQAIPTGNIQAQVEIIDEKIKTERENIDANRKQLKQMDEAVDQVMARSTSEAGASRSLAIRRSQQKERGRILADITTSQEKITALTEERAPIAAQARRVEAEVGPLKYVAAMISSDSTSADSLERAVRWVIVLIVLVFDPLALMLIIAGLKQLEWHREKPQLQELVNEIVPENTHPEVRFDAEPVPPIDINTVNHQLADAEVKREIEYTVLDDADDEAVEHTVVAAVVTDAPSVSSLEQDLQQARRDAELLVEYVQTQDQELKETTRELELTQRALQELTADHNSITDQCLRTLGREQDLTQHIKSLNQQLETLQQERDQLFSAHSYEMARADELVVQLDIIASQSQSVHETGTVDPIDVPENVDQSTRETVDFIFPHPGEGRGSLVESLPGAPDSAEPAPTVPARPPAADFGISFPDAPSRGDMCLRVDFKPSRLFKWNDVKWIEVNKKVTDLYNYSDAYIQFLAEKISAGEYSIDDLSDIEIQQVKTVLGK